MNPRKAAAAVALLLLNQLAFADASYQSTTQITGGSLIDTMKKVSFLSSSFKDMLAPLTTTTMVHGNQKAVLSKDSTEITDLDRECIIRIDNLKKTYTITTFAELRQAFLNMPKQMDKMQAQMKEAQTNQPGAPSGIKTSFDVKVNNPGVTKVVNGLEAQEQVITMTMKVTMTNPPPPAQGQPADPNAPTSMEYTVTTDTWIAPDPPEIKEIADFDIRFGQKLMQGVDMKEFAEQMKQMQAAGNAATAQLLGGQPGAGDAMAQMAKEVAKLKGTRVLEVTSMGGLAPVGTVATASGATTPPPSGQSAASQAASDTATQTASGEASTVSGKTGIFTNALASSVLGGFHHKKPAPAPAPAPATPAATTGTPAMQNVVLMSTTTQKTNFSQASIPLSAFQIPPGYKKVPSPMASMGQ